MWEPPRIANPACKDAPGCGEWKRPTKPNPDYKGNWSAPMIDNPAYKVSAHICLGIRMRKYLSHAAFCNKGLAA